MNNSKLTPALKQQLAETSDNSSHSSLTELDQEQKSTKTMASFNYINSIIGSGIIGWLLFSHNSPCKYFYYIFGIDHCTLF